MSDEIKKFWDNKHTQNHKGSLSGCQYQETVDFLQVADRLKEPCTVLEIGVGLGYVTQGLKDHGHSVHALELSDVGRKRVRWICEKIYSLADPLPPNFFDVILCNNVVQHVPTKTLKVEMKEVVNSLKPDGVMSIEFVGDGVSEDLGDNPTMKMLACGRLCRSEGFMTRLFAECGGTSTTVYDAPVNNPHIKKHYVFHVTPCH